MGPQPAPPGGRGRPPTRRRRHRRHRLLKFVVIIVALLLLIAGGGYGYLRYRLGQIHRVHVTSLQPPASGPFDVLLVGVDTATGGSRADTMIVARVDPATGRASLLSIPYDYFAPIAGTGQSNKISDALNNGATAMAQTVEQDLGIRIAHYVEVNFQGVVGIVNALGGVRLNFPYPSRDTMSGLSVPQPGCVTLNGTQALALVRSRSFAYNKGGSWHYDGTGAFGRIRRQQAFLRAMVHRVESSLFTNPLRLNAFVGATVHDVTVDQGLGVGTIMQLANAFRHLGSSGLSTFTLPTQIVNNDGRYGDVLYPVPSLDASTIAQWRAATQSGSAASPPAGSSSTGAGSSGTSPASTGSGTTSAANGTSSIATPPPPQATPGSVAIVSGTLPFNPTPC